jgi:hypothetical protein
MFVYISACIALLCIEFKLSLIFAMIYFLVAFTHAKPLLSTFATALLGIQTTGGFPLGVLMLAMRHCQFDVEYIASTLCFLSVTDVLIEIYAANGMHAQANPANPNLAPFGFEVVFFGACDGIQYLWGLL